MDYITTGTIKIPFFAKETPGHPTIYAVHEDVGVDAQSQTRRVIGLWFMPNTAL